uniref:Uncharacterized protein n=1 Tax=Rhodnius prolixus TaxID=13249 RepID=T1HE89_RHOPR
MSVLGTAARRRRHKTVHFGETLHHHEDGQAGTSNSCGTGSGSACSSSSGGGGGGGRSGNTNSGRAAGGSSEERGSVHSLPGQFEANVQQLFTFIGNVLSSWERRPEERRRPKKEAVRLLLRGDTRIREDENMSSPGYKHSHWKVPGGSCTALFLKKTSGSDFGDPEYFQKGHDSIHCNQHLQIS